MTPVNCSSVGNPHSIIVFRAGSPCLVGAENDRFRGQILRVSIGSPTDIQYRVVWWDGRSKYEDWFTSHEIQALENTEEIFIGFRD